MKRVNEALFRAVVFCFSAVMIVLSLLNSISLAAANDRAAHMRAQIDALKTENEKLRAAYENSISLEEIERYASEILGMHRRSPDQIIYIELND